jgi:hypothetical protein
MVRFVTITLVLGSLFFLALAVLHGQSERTAYMREHRYMLKIAAKDLTKYGYVTNVWSSSARFSRSTNMVQVAGTQYQCYAKVEGGQFGKEGILAVTTNQVFIWLDRKQPPKIIEAEYKSPLLHF